MPNSAVSLTKLVGAYDLAGLRFKMDVVEREEPEEREPA
jgi:hypothetical protein